MKRSDLKLEIVGQRGRGGIIIIYSRVARLVFHNVLGARGLIGRLLETGSSGWIQYLVKCFPTYTNHVVTRIERMSCTHIEFCASTLLEWWSSERLAMSEFVIVGRQYF